MPRTGFIDAAGDSAKPPKKRDRQCCICKQEIPIDKRGTIALSYGPAHIECVERNKQAMLQLAADAIDAGTHTDKVSTLCPWCREWCDGIYYASTDNNNPMCRNCAEKIGEGPTKHREIREAMERNRIAALRSNAAPSIASDVIDPEMDYAAEAVEDLPF